MTRALPCLLLAPLLLSGCGTALPDLPQSLGRVGSAALPIGPETEAEIGFGIAATVAGRYPVGIDGELTSYLNRVGQAVARESLRLPATPFRFAVLDTDEINAFAAPGGYVFVTRGSLALMESEAELAAVLAHEVVHIDQEHVLHEIRRSAVVGTVRDESQLSGRVLGQVVDLGTGLLFTGLSREDEMEADSLALVLVAAVGYRPHAYVQFLERMEALSVGEDGGLVRTLRATHPAPAERAARARAQLAAAGIDPQEGALLAERFRRHVRRGASP